MMEEEIESMSIESNEEIFSPKLMVSIDLEERVLKTPKRRPLAEIR